MEEILRYVYDLLNILHMICKVDELQSHNGKNSFSRDIIKIIHKLAYINLYIPDIVL